MREVVTGIITALGVLVILWVAGLIGTIPDLIAVPQKAVVAFDSKECPPDGTTINWHMGVLSEGLIVVAHRLTLRVNGNSLNSHTKCNTWLRCCHGNVWRAREMGARLSHADRSELTHRALLDAAQELFAAQGYGATSTVAVVRRAGLARGAMSAHCSSVNSSRRAMS